MSKAITLLQSASGHALVKSFIGPDVIQQRFSTGKLFNVSEETLSDLDYSGSPTASLYTPWTESEVLSHLTTSWGEGTITELKLEYLYGPHPVARWDSTSVTIIFGKQLTYLIPSSQIFEVLDLNSLTLKYGCLFNEQLGLPTL